MEKLAMERLIRCDEQLPLETLVSFAATRAGVTYCHAPRSPAILWRHKWYKGRGSTGVYGGGNRLTLGNLDLMRVFQAVHTKGQPRVPILLTVTRKKLLLNNFDVIFQCLIVPRFLKL